MENVPAKVNDSLPFQLMDRLDDELIIAELEGRMPEILTYHYQDKGNEVWGLSKAGIDEATSELARKGEVIRELEMDWKDGTGEAFFTVKAGRFAINKEGKEILLDTKIGVKRQGKKTVTGKDNPFWFEQGSIKAARNASFRLIPKAVTQGVIEYAKQHSKVKEVEPLPIPETPSTPPSESSEQSSDGVIISSVESKSGEKNGKKWNLYTITINGVKYSTFDTKIGEASKLYCDHKMPILFEHKQEGKYNNLIKVYEPDQPVEG